MLRKIFHWLSEGPSVFAFLKGTRIGRAIASRFVAGETIESGIRAALRLKTSGITATLDLLGESVGSEAEAHAARDEVIETLNAMSVAGLETNVSVKLTQLGLDIGRSICLDNLRCILSRARSLGGFVRIDMESSVYTQRTLELFHRDLLPEYGQWTGVVIQSYLRRSASDVADLIAAGARVRLCKGAYDEPKSVAFPDKREVDRSYVELMEALLLHGRYPALATHDEKIIDHALRFVGRNAIAPERFEFQMLYGVRRDLQHSLRRRGYNLRVYIPFGVAWYPYFMRRLAERPANVAFLAGSFLKELAARGE
jgi:proline dehydrogenase